ncbi:Type I protease secretion protein, haemolytica toxin secretion prtE family (hlyD) [Cupriavidus taiwanensis]|uniref:Membrane fusion protein (MFP) family protein n=2 Tax=Cupriavidus taiwanensis TaxID=164546 RepID=A0A976B150_9BURK|nr:HlyD family type I secretion periplasmic adaptor subunit [Cupriavidus taiwanensis]SOZ64906.1 Type I protease secretion protein, haemolytica toxin secretion prtE family (hlyD) [Cupriavidus taiwanensis]SOZ65737.1 Type I protease secretion protein, haemolytica toxin secretion prtE family (hlyD) [Cupriavidus taiwanensis]SOZ69514.1 Type I protease secretion protein, haemolytica toxin secretion prtE family (hlyD) [Cupriavidus taiwanensis]SPA01802.1 Type I protease secretion protein, haemolytica to
MSPRPEPRTLARRVAAALRPHADDTAFMDARDAAALSRPRWFAHWILWCAVGFVGVALTWAALARVDEVAVGEGKVIPSSQVQVVQNLEGGIVAQIMVRPGQVVSKDQPLMRIDDTRFTASYQEGRTKDDALVARIARLSAEADGTDFVAGAGGDGDTRRFVAEERSLFASRRHALEANLAVLRQQSEQRRQELTEKRSREQQLRQSHRLVAQELAMMRPMVAQGVVSDVDVLRLERQTNDLKGELDASRLAMPRLEAAYRESQQKLAEASAHFRAEAMRELNQVRAEQAALSATNTVLQDRVDRTLVRAPLAGIVKQLKINTVGGVVQPGMDLVEIVPLEDTLLVEARVRPADIAFLRPGQPAVVKLSAYDFSVYGGFAGTVEHISADTLTPERPGERPESYYLVRVRTRDNRPAGSAVQVPILPGMVATVDVLTGQKTVLHYLLKPIIKTRDMAFRER